MKSLFGAIEVRSKEKDKALINKLKNKSPATKRGGGLAVKMSQIESQVNGYLGKFKNVYECVTVDNEDHLVREIDNAIENDIIAIDTETTGLNPLVDKCVGFSIYTVDGKALYVPLEHVSYITGIKIKKQISKDFAVQQLKRLEDARTKIIMFNAVFDIRVLRNQLGVNLECWWDVSLASRCMNENEPQKALKKLYQKYILKGEEDAFKFDELFNDIGFDKVPYDIGYLYAAHDAKITYDMYDFQKKYLYYDDTESKEARNGMNGVAWVFRNIEMPCVSAVVDLEDTGVAFDRKYAKELSVKYHAILKEKEKNFHKLCSMYKDMIDDYSGKVRFDDPININSVPQLQALLYDVLKLEGPIDKKTKKPSRSTSEAVLSTLKEPIADAILEYREFSTIVSTFIDKLPNCVHSDGRIHCNFNQYGADTGRFSSKNPNLQNIPSHNKDIRKMFKATDGYVLMSSDFSQQEIKGMAQMCQDEYMIDAFKKGRDFYSDIASVAFGYPYEDCLEFQVDENGKEVLDKNGEPVTNPGGKERRSQAKSILLGINYGRGAKSIAEQLGCSQQKAEKIKHDVFKSFPAIEKFEKDSIRMAEEEGYVTTLWGRKRRLPILTHPDYEFEWAEGAGLSDDPLDFDDEEIEDEVPYEIVRKWTNKLSRLWSNKEKAYQINQAKQDGIIITDNSKKRIDAKRQVVNSRIQGTAADQSKLAMIKVWNDERLRELGFRMLIPVHDEIIAECPKENAKECKERFQHLMETSGGDAFTIPISCDVTVTERWYGESVEI